MNSSNDYLPDLISKYPEITLAHGGGGTLMRELIEKVFRDVFDNPILSKLHDAAEISVASKRLGFTSDSYVVSPLVFPGGDIGSLAIHGTVNDLAMSGARARYIASSFILEEGLAMATLWQIVQSMKVAASACQVPIVTGDTKVVDRGKGDGIFITTTGVGEIEHQQKIEANSIATGDAILLSGDIGRHGVAVICSREGLSFDQSIASDSASLWPEVAKLLEEDVTVRCMRDLTRGGLASALVELATASGFDFVIEEENVAVNDAVRGPCELLGLEPLYVANEGRFVLFVPEAESAHALEILRNFNADAAIIGQVDGVSPGRVTLRQNIGTERVIDLLSGEQLPRIC